MGCESEGRMERRREEEECMEQKRKRGMKGNNDKSWKIIRRRKHVTHTIPKM